MDFFKKKPLPAGQKKIYLMKVYQHHPLVCVVDSLDGLMLVYTFWKIHFTGGKQMFNPDKFYYVGLNYKEDGTLFSMFIFLVFFGSSRFFCACVFLRGRYSLAFDVSFLI